MVGNILRLMLGRGISIVRWNNFPRVVDVKHMDNVGLCLHVALYLSYIEEHTFGNKIDTLYVVKKIIFTSLSDLILSDINSGTKTYIKKHDADMCKKLYDTAFEYIYSFDGPDFLLDDMKATIENTSHTYEDSLLKAARKYVGFVESGTNARVFPEMYEVPMNAIHEELVTLSDKLPSLDFVMNDIDSQKFLAHIQRLSSAMRWNQYRRTFPISVMSHKVIVAYLAYVIGMYENHVLGTNHDITKMLMRAIYHDVPEVITGDIVTPTKQAVVGFAELLEQVETQMVEDYLFSYVSPEYKTYISSYMLDPFSGVLGKRVKYADRLSALFEAKLEDISGNGVFSEITKTMMKDLSQISHLGVEYIIKDMVLNFGEVREDILK